MDSMDFRLDEIPICIPHHHPRRQPTGTIGGTTDIILLTITITLTTALGRLQALIRHLVVRLDRLRGMVHPPSMQILHEDFIRMAMHMRMVHHTCTHIARAHDRDTRARHPLREEEGTDQTILLLRLSTMDTLLQITTAIHLWIPMVTRCRHRTTMALRTVHLDHPLYQRNLLSRQSRFILVRDHFARRRFCVRVVGHASIRGRNNG